MQKLCKRKRRKMSEQGTNAGMKKYRDYNWSFTLEEIFASVHSARRLPRVSQETDFPRTRFSSLGAIFVRRQTRHIYPIRRNFSTALKLLLFRSKLLTGNIDSNIQQEFTQISCAPRGELGIRSTEVASTHDSVVSSMSIFWSHRLPPGLARITRNGTASSAISVSSGFHLPCFLLYFVLRGDFFEYLPGAAAFF